MTADVDLPIPDTGDLTRQAPQDLQAEIGVLGACLLAESAISTVLEAGLQPEHFYGPHHERIFRAIVDMHDAGHPIDATTLATHLHRAGDLRRAGGAGYLHTLLASCPAPASAGYYARSVLEASVHRRLIAAGTRIVQIGYATDGGDIGEIVDAARAELAGVDDLTDVTLGENVVDDIDGVLTRVETGVNSVPTPWVAVNTVLGGWVRGNLYVIGARPGDGKSITGLQAGLHMAVRHGQPVTYMSLEMTKDQLVHRVLSQVGRVDLSHLARGGAAMTDDDWARVIRAQEVLSTGGPGGGYVPLHLVDRPAATLADIRAANAATERRYGTPPGLIVVDYLQLMSGGGRVENRQVLVAAISQGLKALAKELDVPVIVLSQLRRPTAGTNTRPAMSDLRESGSIEQDGDVVILLHRTRTDDGEDYTGIVEMIVAKNRQGDTDVVPLRWDAAHARILDPYLDDAGRPIT